MNEYLVGTAGILIGVYSGYKLNEALSKRESVRSRIRKNYETIINYKEVIL
jgi:hypothetical protein